MNCELIESAANQKRGISKLYGSEQRIERVPIYKTTRVDLLVLLLTTRKLFLSSHTILYMYVRMYFVPYIAYMHTPAMWKFETVDAEVRRLERASERAGRCRQSPPSPLPSRNNALSLLEPNNIILGGLPSISPLSVQRNTTWPAALWPFAFRLAALPAPLARPPSCPILTPLPLHGVCEQ